MFLILFISFVVCVPIEKEFELTDYLLQNSNIHVKHNDHVKSEIHNREVELEEDSEEMAKHSKDLQNHIDQLEHELSIGAQQSSIAIHNLYAEIRHLHLDLDLERSKNNAISNNQVNSGGVGLFAPRQRLDSFTPAIISQ